MPPDPATVAAPVPAPLQFTFVCDVTFIDGPPVFVIVTVEVDEAQGAFEIVHMNTFAPTPKPVTPDVGDDEVVIVPAPLTSVHVPVPVTGALPANVAELLQSDWFGPALDVVGAATPVMVTVEVDGEQGGLTMLHMNTFAPTPNPVTPDVGEEGVVIVPAPLTNVHVPVPVVGAFPANVAVVPQIDWFDPAAEVVGPPVLNIVTVSVLAVQGGFAMVHMNTLAPETVPVIVLLGEPGAVIVPEPLTSVHVPVPVAGVFPAIVKLDIHPDCVGPAFAAVGVATLVIVTVDKDAVHGAFEMVH